MLYFDFDTQMQEDNKKKINRIWKREKNIQFCL